MINSRSSERLASPFASTRQTRQRSASAPSVSKSASLPSYSKIAMSYESQGIHQKHFASARRTMLRVSIPIKSAGTLSRTWLTWPAHKNGAILFDVGANVGHTVLSFRSHFSSPVIHAFEPSPSTFEQLKQQTSRIPDLCLNNFALGSRLERKVLIESAMNTLNLSPHAR